MGHELDNKRQILWNQTKVSLNNKHLQRTQAKFYILFVQILLCHTKCDALWPKHHQSEWFVIVLADECALVVIAISNIFISTPSFSSSSSSFQTKSVQPNNLLHRDEYAPTVTCGYEKKIHKISRTKIQFEVRDKSLSMRIQTMPTGT